MKGLFQAPLVYSVINRGLTSFDSVFSNRTENIDQKRNIFKAFLFH
jgi:hypothetical protein